ncbi:tryptophan 7-halogenase [Chloroflexi bacterium TSY]|nr:tryptophan 7-halogenase [Chloroflexi bacterium TSY]
MRDPSPQMKTDSRVFFNHMVGVKLMDELCDREAHGLFSPLSQDTLHHLFEDGWFWIIPFNNHVGATNPLCSVGLCLDRRVSPEGDSTPEEEFWSFVHRFPTVAKQLESAQPVRNWVSTGRVQYRSKRAVGDRFCLLPHSVGFVEPFFSGGLTIAFDTINLLAARLLDALKEGDFSSTRFAAYQALIENDHIFYDRLVYCSYIAFSNFELWNAWHRIWVIGQILTAFGRLKIILNYVEKGTAQSLMPSRDRHIMEH